MTAQALVAATSTVDESLRAHSLHAYFLRPGTTGYPVVFHNERLHDGSTFRRRRVTVVQHGNPVPTSTRGRLVDSEASSSRVVVVYFTARTSRRPRAG